MHDSIFNDQTQSGMSLTYVGNPFEIKFNKLKDLSRRCLYRMGKRCETIQQIQL